MWVKSLLIDSALACQRPFFQDCFLVCCGIAKAARVCDEDSEAFAQNQKEQTLGKRFKRTLSLRDVQSLSILRRFRV